MGETNTWANKDKLTADKARMILDKSADEIVGDILKDIEKLAHKLKREIKVTDYGFDACLHPSADMDARSEKVLEIFKSLGYYVKVEIDESTNCTETYLSINW